MTPQRLDISMKKMRLTWQIWKMKWQIIVSHLWHFLWLVFIKSKWHFFKWSYVVMKQMPLTWQIWKIKWLFSQNDFSTENEVLKNRFAQKSLLKISWLFSPFCCSFFPTSVDHHSFSFMSTFKTPWIIFYGWCLENLNDPFSNGLTL